MRANLPPALRHRALAVAAALATGLCLQACLGNSFLNEAGRYIQPGWVRVSLDVIKERDLSDGSVRASLEARFYDRDNERIVFDDGSVYVNGQKMNRHSALFVEFYRLSGGGIRFVHDTTYVFKIVIDDKSGTAYICSVKTPRGDLDTASVAVSADSATVAWSGDTTLPLRLHYTLSRGTDSTIENATRERTFTPPLPAALRVPLEDYTDFRMTRLETVTNGVVDPAFRGGSIEALVRLVP